MYKLCLNSRDELLVIDMKKIAFFQANGNYTQMFYISGENRLLSIGLTKIEEVIRISWPKGTPSPFVRLGRSLIVNQSYLSEISVLRQRLVLSDWAGNSHALTVPKPLLKNYKEHIYNQYQSKINREKNKDGE